MDNNFPTLKEILELIRIFIEEASGGEFPEDEFVYISDVWDVNLARVVNPETDETEEMVYIHPTQEGQVITSIAIKIPWKDLKNLYTEQRLEEIPHETEGDF